RSTSSATSRLRTMVRSRVSGWRAREFVKVADVMAVLLASEGLQVFDQRILVGGREFGAVRRAFVTGVAVARQRGVEQEAISGIAFRAGAGARCRSALRRIGGAGNADAHRIDQRAAAHKAAW